MREGKELKVTGNLYLELMKMPRTKASAVRNLHAILHNYKYERVRNRALCVYCGDHAKCWDHFPPLSKVWKVHGTVFMLVPCCHDCNMRSRAKLFRTINAKRKWCMKTAIENADFPRMSEQELREMCDRKEISEFAFPYILRELKNWYLIPQDPILTRAYIAMKHGDWYEDE